MRQPLDARVARRENATSMMTQTGRNLICWQGTHFDRFHLQFWTSTRNNSSSCARILDLVTLSSILLSARNQERSKDKAQKQRVQKNPTTHNSPCQRHPKPFLKAPKQKRDVGMLTKIAATGSCFENDFLELSLRDEKVRINHKQWPLLFLWTTELKMSAQEKCVQKYKRTNVVSTTQNFVGTF